ncbi:hypothetical protein RND71_005106 [Anisodus tanguticus]|uniref:Uncharacterized protein n=1 Tax=Anisodus tanguticus TaxID=243964 RepID=A0AAE1SPE1_9SOLA|nr:hypothetical protein RND71_005106 [Anisodus tanguticus]
MELLEMESMASAIGVSIPVLRFYFVSLPLFLHVYYMSGDAWKKGGMDATDLKTFRQRTAVAFWGNVKGYSSSNLVPLFPISKFLDPMYHEWVFWTRLGYQYMASFTARCKYYFIWSISEVAIIVSGFGFSGWSDMINPPKPQWDRAKNVDILGVELAKSSVQIPLVWNIQVSTWLRHYVYERLRQKGRKSGFFQLLATQTVSAVWHVLSLHETITAYGSVYYIGTVVPILVIPLGNMIQPAKPVRSREE